MSKLESPPTIDTTQLLAYAFGRLDQQYNANSFRIGGEFVMKLHQYGIIVSANAIQYRSVENPYDNIIIVRCRMLDRNTIPLFKYDPEPAILKGVSDNERTVLGMVNYINREIKTAICRLGITV